ncbi:class I SAM-dependent methyltransferase [Micromonospora sp. NPDC049559]|uniref:class I SAM-dependent methyltransferase n=1 Tax=Micromonospora sp. NPDC049559 TaxID=3155923 RepID=UPI00341756A5
MTVTRTDALPFADWLALREAADAVARSAELLEPVRRRLAGNSAGRAGPAAGSAAPLVVHDLGSGTGSMGRWLAPRLPGPQHWIMYDRDPELLEQAAARMVSAAADGAPVTVETRRRDITRLTADDLRGAALVTASALLDMLTAEEIERMVATCAAAGRPTWLTLSVVGRVELTPADPLDSEIADAFNAHQRRRTADGRRLLGPDAADAAVAAFGRHGVEVRVRSSPWRLGPDQAALSAEWFAGWLDAAREQRPELTGRVTAYARRRRAEAAEGRLGVVVHHHDLLANCE